MSKDEAMKLALEALRHFEKAGLATLKTIDAITAIKQALEHPEPEPVAWITQNGKGWLRWHKPDDNNTDSVPLYKSPPKREWQGLTDEEVQMVPKEKDMGVAEVKDAMSRLDKELDVYRNEVLEEVAVVIEQFKGSFGQDTVMSFAALVRGMKR